MTLRCMTGLAVATVACNCATAGTIESLSSPRPSPDGARLLCQGAIDGTSVKVVLDLSKDGPPIILNSIEPAQGSGGNWAPDGSRIVFYSGHESRGLEIYTMDRDGGDVRRLTNNSFHDAGGLWSPVGDTILFTTVVPHPTERAANGGPTRQAVIATVDIDGRNRTVRTPVDAWNFDPSWSNAGDRFVSQCTIGPHVEFFVQNADGSERRRLSQSEGEDPVLHFYAEWAPDDSFVVFKSTRDTASRGDLKDPWEIHRMNIDGTGERNLTQTPEIEEASVSFSPDGAWIAFMARRAAERDAEGAIARIAGPWDIYVMRPDGSQRRRLTTSGEGFQNRNPAWAPNGAGLYFDSERSGMREIWFVNVNDGSIELISRLAVLD